MKDIQAVPDGHQWILIRFQMRRYHFHAIVLQIKSCHLCHALKLYGLHHYPPPSVKMVGRPCVAVNYHQWLIKPFGGDLNPAKEH